MTTTEALAVVREARPSTPDVPCIHCTHDFCRCRRETEEFDAALALIEQRVEELQRDEREAIEDRDHVHRRNLELEAALREIAEATEADLDYLRERWRGESFVIPETVQKLAEALVIARRALGGTHEDLPGERFE